MARMLWTWRKVAVGGIQEEFRRLFMIDHFYNYKPFTLELLLIGVSMLGASSFSVLPPILKAIHMPHGVLICFQAEVSMFEAFSMSDKRSSKCQCTVV